MALVLTTEAGEERRLLEVTDVIDDPAVVAAAVTAARAGQPLVVGTERFPVLDLRADPAAEAAPRTPDGSRSPCVVLGHRGGIRIALLVT